MKKKALDGCRSYYVKIINVVPISMRFDLVLVLSYLLSPIFYLFLVLDQDQKKKYSLHKGLPLPLVWLLFPLQNTPLIIEAYCNKEVWDTVVTNRSKSILIIGYHGLLIPAFNLKLIDAGLEPVTVGLRSKQFFFGRFFENDIQPNYMFLNRVRNMMVTNRIVGVMIDTHLQGKQTTQINTRFGALPISTSLFKIAMATNTDMVFIAQRFHKRKLFIDTKVVSGQSDLNEVIREYELFLT